MRIVELTQGKVAIVCDCCWHKVSGYKWHYLPQRGNTGGPYAGTMVTVSYAPNRKQVQVRMHHLIGGKGWDHIDGNGLNNQCSNLRPATAQQNTRNRGPQRGKVSSFKGVSRASKSNRWIAGITVDGMKIELGSFDNEWDAALAYDTAAEQYFGEFAWLNRDHFNMEQEVAA